MRMFADAMFRGGIPFSLDIRILSDRFPSESLVEGRVITHEQFERALGFDSTVPRYYGVINSWIDKQRLVSGVITVWLPGVGVKILNPAEAIGHAQARVAQKTRQLERATETLQGVSHG